MCFEKELVDLYLLDDDVLSEIAKDDQALVSDVVSICFEMFVQDLLDIIENYENPVIDFKLLKKYVAQKVIDLI